MPRKVQPRWGWKPEINQAAFEKCFQRVNDQLVLELLGVSDSDNTTRHIKVISEIMGTFFWAYFEPDYPSNKEINAALQELQKAAKQFEHHFFKLDWLSEQKLTQQIKSVIASRSDQATAEIYQTYYDMLFSEPYVGRNMLDFLFEAIRITNVEERPARRGRPANYPIKNLIVHLARYYELCTGRNASKGVAPDPITGEFKSDFVQLTEHLLRSFDPNLSLSHEAIGEQIRSTIGDRSGPKDAEILDAEAVCSEEDVIVSSVYVSEICPTEDGGAQEHVLFSSHVKRPRS